MKTSNRLRFTLSRPPFIPLLTAALFLLGGCRAPEASAPAGPGDTAIRNLESAGLRIDGIFNPDGTLAPSPQVGVFIPNQPILVEDMVAMESDGGFKRVQVRVTNRDKSGKSLEYRFLWFDAAGFEVGQATGGWSVVPIKARETVSLPGTARTAEVASFQLFIREVKFKK